MTLEEMGKRLKKSPQMLAHYTPEELELVDDASLAIKALEKFPEYWDLISPIARRLNDLSKGQFSRKRWFDWLLSSETINSNDMQQHSVIRSEADTLNHIQLVARAGHEGLDVASMMEIRRQVEVVRQAEMARAEAQIMVMEAQTRQTITLKEKDLDIQIRTMKANADAVLYAARTELMVNELEAGHGATEAGRRLVGAVAEDAGEVPGADAVNVGDVIPAPGELGDEAKAG